MANLREALASLEKFLGMNIDCDSLLLFYGACQKAGVDLNKFMEKLAGNPTLLKNFSSILDLVAPIANIFTINRAASFDPTAFIGTGWSFWRGPKDGKGLKGDLEQDARSLDLKEIDLNKIQFKSYIPDGQSVITGEARLEAIKASGDIGYDPKFGQDLFQEPGQKSLRWLYDNKGVTWMEFTGQTLRSPYGCRYFLCLDRNDLGSWHWIYRYLDDDRRVSNTAAVSSK